MRDITSERILWREVLKQQVPLILPPAHDALTARIIERMGGI